MQCAGQERRDEARSSGMACARTGNKVEVLLARRVEEAHALKLLVVGGLLEAHDVQLPETYCHLQHLHVAKKIICTRNHRIPTRTPGCYQCSTTMRVKKNSEQ